MANEATGGRGRQNSAQKSVEKAAVETPEHEVRPIPTKDVDPHQIVTVRNGFHGRLVYKSPKTGERFVWEEFGSEQDMEIAELRNAKSANKKYFENNWFMFDEQWITEYLGLGQYYKFAIPIAEFDEFFEKPAGELEKALAKLSKGQKQSVAYRARQLIREGSIDSNKTIAILEKCLDIELVEHDR